MSSAKQSMKLYLKIWRQDGPNKMGKLVDYTLENVSPNSSFLEMLDTLNENLIKKGEMPVQFDSDCREGICGMCGVVINGQAHGPEPETTTCQLHMRTFHDGDTIVIEPFRAKAFPVLRDLAVDRTSLDRIIAAGGYVSARSGPHIDGNAIPVPRTTQEQVMDMAACIGCGACVAACPNASASLFTAAKISQFALLPQGQPERERRVKRMVDQMDAEQFGHCSNHGDCEAACPAGISIDAISRMRREYMRSFLFGPQPGKARAGGDG